MKREILALRVDPDVKAALEAEAKRLGLTTTEVCRRALGEYVARRKRIPIDTQGT